MHASLFSSPRRRGRTHPPFPRTAADAPDDQPTDSGQPCVADTIRRSAYGEHRRAVVMHVAAAPESAAWDVAPRSHPGQRVRGECLLGTEIVRDADGYPDIGVALQHADRCVAVVEGGIPEPRDGLCAHLAVVVVEVLLRIGAGYQHHADGVCVRDIGIVADSARAVK